MGNCGFMSTEFVLQNEKRPRDWVHNNVHVLDTSELYA